FFQAEDGIRDATVTGVQTCALPISPPDGAANVSPDAVVTITFPLDLDVSTVTRDTVHVLDYSLADTLGTLEKDKKPRVLAARVRSEERRVGKGCRTRGGAEE